MDGLKNILKVFLKIDQFGVPLNLRVANQDAFNTHLGALTSVFLFGIMMSSIYGLFYGLFSKSDPFVLVNETYQRSPGKYMVNPLQFDLAFMIQGNDQTTISQEDTLNVTEAIFAFVQFEGVNLASYQQIDFIPCQLDPVNEERILGSVGTVQEIFTKGLCLNSTQWKEVRDKTFLLGGYTDQNLSEIKFVLNKSYKASQQLRNKLENANLYLTFPDISVNQQNTEQPLQSNHILKILSLSLDNFSRSRNSLSAINFLDNDNLWYFFPQTFQYQALRIKQQADSLYAHNLTLLDMAWYQDNLSTTYIRNYPSILDVLGNLGGLYQVLFYVLGAIITPIAKTQCNLHIINDIFDFPDQEGRNSKIFNEKALQNLPENGLRKAKTMKEIRKITTQFRQGLGQNLWVSLKYLFCQDNVYNVAEKKVHKYLDFLKLVKIYDNLNYLSKILLNDDQSLLFKLKQKRYCEPRRASRLEIETLDFQQIFQAYVNLKQTNSSSDQVILLNLDTTIQRYISQLDCSESKEQIASPSHEHEESLKHESPT